MAESGSKKRLEGKVAVVTGAGNGIGRAEALLLARDGAKVVVNDLGCDVSGKGTDKSAAHSVVDEIRAEGGEAVANGDSVTTMEGGKRIIAAAIDAFGRLDILINTAGTLRPRMIYEMSEDDWDSVIAVHLKGSFTTIRHAAPIFREQRSGVIVNTSSEAGLGMYGAANYSAAKEGVVGLTRTVARDLGQYNVRCNAIRPVALTRMSIPESLESIRISEEVLGIPHLGKRWAYETWGDISPENVAALAVWLCTDAAAQVNGRTFQICGGVVGLYSEPELTRTIFRPKGWNLDTLDDPAIRAYLISNIDTISATSGLSRVQVSTASVSEVFDSYLQ